MPSQSKFASFKNRSQLSLSSNKSGRKRQSFYDQSPIESPLHSPTTSPTGNFQAGKEALSNTKDNTPASVTDPRNRYRQSTNSLQRSQSQRSPRSPPSDPVTHLDSKQAPQRPQTNRLVKKTNPNPETKKKRTFWGLVSSNSRKSSAQSSQDQGANDSRRGVVPPRANSQVSEERDRQNWQSSSHFPSPTVEEESEEDIVTKNFYRHSVAFPTNFAASNPLSTSDDSSTRDYNYTQFRSPPFTTASSQQSSEQEGKAPVWERIGRGPHHRNPSDQQHQTLHPSQSTTNPSSGSKIRLDIGFVDTAHSSNSRPPSRQSIEPPSPSSFSHGPFHQRSGSSQKSSFIEGPMVSSTQQHSTGRGSEAGQQGTQSGSRGEGMEQC